MSKHLENEIKDDALEAVAGGWGSGIECPDWLARKIADTKCPHCQNKCLVLLNIETLEPIGKDWYARAEVRCDARGCAYNSLFMDFYSHKG